MNETIPFSKVTLGKEEEEAALRVLRSGWLAAGPETKAFEEEFSAYISPPGESYHCIYTNSCTSALKMAYKWAKEQGIGAIYYPKNTFCATYSAGDESNIMMIAEPIGTCGKASIPGLNLVRVNVHYGGVKDKTPCFIEDSAHRIEPNDPLVGKIRCYSFYATKNMTTASGGMFVTNDKDIYERARTYWRDGLTTSTADRAGGKQGYRVEALAGGYDGNDLGAAIGRVQLRKLPSLTRRRDGIVRRYNAAFGTGWKGNHLYPYLVRDEEAAYGMIAALKDEGIACSHHYPGTGWNGVSLPLYPLLTDGEVERVVEACLRIGPSFGGK